MRRGSVTALTQAGVSDHLVQKHMRVVSNSTVRRYATLSQEKLGKISRVVFRASAQQHWKILSKYGAYFLCSTLLCGEPYPDVRCRSHPNTRTWVLGCLVSNRNEVLFWKPLDGKLWFSRNNSAVKMGNFPGSGIRNKQVSDIESGYPDIESGYPDIRI